MEIRFAIAYPVNDSVFFNSEIQIWDIEENHPVLFFEHAQAIEAIKACDDLNKRR